MDVSAMFTELFTKILETVANIEFWSQIFAPTSIAWGFILILILLFVLAFIGAKAPGFPGLPLGTFDVEGYWGENPPLHRRYTGNLVDCTPEWLNEYVCRTLKQKIISDLEAKIKAETNPEKRSEHEQLKDKFESEDFFETLKVYGLRTTNWKKHLFIMVFPNKNERNVFPSGYIAPKPEPKFSLFSLDWFSKAQILGKIYTIPRQWKIPRIGKVSIHIFFPWKFTSNPTENKNNQVSPEKLETIALGLAHVPSYVDLIKTIKQKDRLIQDTRKYKAYSDKVAQSASAVTDAVGIVMSVYQKHPEIAKMMRRMLPGAALDYASLFIVIGMLVGAFLSYKLTLPLDPVIFVVLCGVAGLILGWILRR